MIMEKKTERIEVICDLSLKPILTEKEACVFLGFQRAYLQEMRVTGKIGFYKAKNSTSIRYKQEHLLKYIKDNYDEMKPLEMRYRQ